MEVEELKRNFERSEAQLRKHYQALIDEVEERASQNSRKWKDELAAKED